MGSESCNSTSASITPIAIIASGMSAQETTAANKFLETIIAISLCWNVHLCVILYANLLLHLNITASQVKLTVCRAAFKVSEGVR
jgi:hypothetical protein